MPVIKAWARGKLGRLYLDLFTNSRELIEKRILNIYLTSGYKARDTITYPLTYLLDRSADKDSIYVAGIYQFNNFNVIDRVSKSIIVGNHLLHLNMEGRE